MVKARAEMNTISGINFITERSAFNFENAMDLIMSDLREAFDTVPDADKWIGVSININKQKED